MVAEPSDFHIPAPLDIGPIDNVAATILNQRLPLRLLREAARRKTACMGVM
jgi:hypothetical protein